MSNLGTFLSRARGDALSTVVMGNDESSFFDSRIMEKITGKKTLWKKVKECYAPKDPYTGERLGIDALDEYGRSALMNAATVADFVAMKLLVEHGADPTLTDDDGKTVLDYLLNGEMDGFITDILHRKQDICQILAEATQFLLDKGVPVSVDTWVNSGNRGMNAEAVKVLSKVTDIHAVDSKGNNFFSYACRSLKVWADQQGIDVLHVADSIEAVDAEGRLDIRMLKLLHKQELKKYEKYDTALTLSQDPELYTQNQDAGSNDPNDDMDYSGFMGM